MANELRRLLLVGRRYLHSHGAGLGGGVAAHGRYRWARVPHLVVETSQEVQEPREATRKTTTGEAMTDLLWEGRSALDGAPIVVLGVSASGNSKTGRVYQTYILRADMEPSQATRTNADVSICGDCPHRGVGDGKFARSRTCYVFTPRGPTIVYRTWKAGKAED